MKKNLQVKNRVREILKIVQQLSPDNSVEVRIPPYAVIQCVSGSVHIRGTLPNVVEMSRDTLLKLVDNPTYWDEFCRKGRISTLGTNSNLKDLFTQVSKLDSGSK